MGPLRTAIVAAAVVLASALAVVLPSVSRANGCTITWVGDIDGSWLSGTPGNNTNWDDNTLPGTADHVCIDGPANVGLSGSSASVNHYTVANGATLTISGVRLRALADSSNAGAIVLSGAGSALGTENGTTADVETLTNTGTITSSGTGGEQAIEGDIVNQGTITVGHELVRMKTLVDARAPKLTNGGQLTASAGGRLVVAGTLALQASGTVSGPGVVDVDTFGRLEVAGGTIADGADLNAVGGSGNCCGNSPGAQVVFPGASSATGTIGVSTGLGGRHALIGNVPTGVTLELETSGVLVAAGDWTNAGTIRLSGSNSALLTENGVNTDVETLTNAGTIISSGTGDARTLGGDIVNQGTLSARHPNTVFARADGNRQSRLTNTGALDATAGNRLVLPATTLALSTGGTVSGPGAIDVDTSARLEVAGGTIAANADLNATGGSGNCCGNAPGAQVVFGGASATGTVGVSGGGRHALSGNVPAGVTLDLEASGVLVAASDWTNAGTIRLSGSNSALLTENGVNTNVETLTNAGTIISSGTGDVRTLGGDIVNQGTLSARHPNTVLARGDGNRMSKLANAGALGATAGNRLHLDATALTLGIGGTVSGPGTIDVGTSGALVVAGGVIDASADLNAAGGSGNCCGNAPGASLEFIPGTGATGEIGVTSPLGGAHTLSGDIPPQISLDITTSRLLAPTSTTNAGAIELGSGGTLGVAAPGTLTNAGTMTSSGGTIQAALINAGSLEALPVSGTFTQTPDGRLVVSAPGTTSSTLAVSGAASLDGELSIETGAPPPALNQTHNAVTTAARSGTFSNVAGRAGGPWAVLYQSPGVVLQAVPPGTTGPELSIEPAELVEGNAGTANMVFTARLAQATDHPVTAEWHTVDDTADSPTDFTESAGLVTFPTGDTTKTISVPIKGDTAVEPGETFLLRLRGPRGASLGAARATGTIVSDDLGITSSSPERVGAGQVTLTVLGGGFLPATTVKLARPGRADIAGTILSTDAGRSRMTARFGLAEAPLGVWDLVVTAPGGASATRLGALTIESPVAARLSVAVNGPGAVRNGFVGRATVSLHNEGNVDAELQSLHVTGRNVVVRTGATGPFSDLPTHVAGDLLTAAMGGATVVPGGETRRVLLRFRSTSNVPHTPLEINVEALDENLVGSTFNGPDPDADGRITGVLQTTAGIPVPGIPVSAARPPQQGGATAVALTAADGTFTLGPLPNGSYQVAPGAEPSRSPAVKPGVITAAAPTPAVILVQDIAEVAGTVRRPDGSRVTDARVTLVEGDEVIDRTRADAAGAFAFAVTASGTYRLRASSPSAGLASLGGVVVEAGTARSGLRLETGGRQVNVTVTDAGGGPIEGALATLRLDGDSFAYNKRSGADGVATFPGVPAGAIAVEAAALDRTPATGTIAAGATAASLELGAGGRIAGTLTSAGSPVGFAAVIAVERGTGRERRALSAPSGQYVVKGLAAAMHDVWIAGPGLAPKLVESVIVAGGATTPLDATLDATGTTQDVALRVPGGGPAYGAEVSLLHVPTGARLITTYAGVDGVARLGPVPTGSFALEAALPGTPTASKPVGGARRDLTTFDLRQAGAIPRPGSGRESLYYADPPRFALGGVEEPVPSQYQLTGEYLDYLHLQTTFTPPCEYATHLSRMLDLKRNLMSELFTRYHRAWFDMDFANNVDLANYLIAYGKLVADVITLGKVSSAARLGGDLIYDGADLANAGQAQLITMGQAVLAAVETGQPPSGAVLAEQAQAALETARAYEGPQHVEQHNKLSRGIAGLNLARDILKFSRDVEKFPDNVRQRGDAYLQAQAKYLQNVEDSNAMTNELRRIAPNCPDDPDDPGPTRPPDGGNGGRGPSGSYTGDGVNPDDPNDVQGPAGVGAQRWVGADADLPYTIRFENKPSATAPAVLVTVSHVLDADVDLDAFALGDLGWGDRVVPVPDGLQSFHGEVALADGDVVRVDAALERATRTVRWTLATIDPDTGELAESVTAGFLPPEDGTGRGQGHVTYSTQPVDGIAHDTEITAQARIVFDFNEAIDTPLWSNRVDATPPASAVTSVTQAPGATCSDDLQVNWSGTDTGSGIATFDILVSTGGGPFVPWLAGTTQTAATFAGVAGSTHAFASVARDGVGLAEAPPATADAQRTVACDRTAPTTIASVSGAPSVGGFRSGPVEVLLTGVDSSGGSGVDRVTWAATGASPGGASVAGDEAKVPVSADGETVVAARSRDAAGNEAAPRSITVRIDSKAPVVSVASPAEGARIVSGSGAVADFACTDAGSGIASCVGSIADGAPIDGGTPGARTLTVTAVDKLGKETRVTRAFQVVAPGAAGKLKLLTNKARLDAKRRIALKLRCTGARCAGTLGLAQGKRRVASARFALAAGKTATVRVRFSKKVVKRIRKAGKAKLTVSAGGRLGVVTVKPAKPKK